MQENKRGHIGIFQTKIKQIEHQIEHMSNIFLLSDSYSANTYSFLLQYVLSTKVEKLILLSENHSHEDMCLNGQFDVSLCKTLDECLNECDIVLSIVNESIPNSSIDHIDNICAVTGKKHIRLSNSANSDNGCTKTIHSDIEYKQHPVILIITKDDYSQNYCVEILLNKIFNDYGIAVSQTFSETTLNILTQLNQNSCLSKVIVDQINYDYADYDVLIETITIDKASRKNTLECMFENKNITPDYIIYQTNEDNCDFDYLNNIIRIIFNKSIDTVIKSRYHVINDSTVIYCANDDDNGDVEYVNSESLEYTLSHHILTQISLPNGVIDINNE